MDEHKAPQEEELSVEEMLCWAEFCAWSALVMTPIIWWLQGASVSTDQFVVRTALVVISALVGVGLRVRAWIVGRRGAKEDGGASRSSSEARPLTPGPSPAGGEGGGEGVGE